MTRFLSYLFSLTAGLILGAAILYGAAQHQKIHRLQQLSLPVVSDMRVVDQMADEDATYIHVIGRKMRDCGPPVAIRAVYGADLERISNVTFLNDLDGDNIHPPYERRPGEQDFGWWRLRPPIVENPLVMYVFHECGDALVRTTIGPIEIIE